MAAFLAFDPRGYAVMLTDECWERHILVQHPEMYKLEDEVRKTIETPDAVYSSKYNRRSRLYFRRISVEPLEYIVVSVDMRERTKRGFVQTALIVDDMSKGGTILWQGN